jgi:flagellin-like hook-associated protein FlgL
LQKVLASLKETNDALQGMLSEVQSLRGLFAEIENPVNNQYPESYATKIGLAIDSLINIANKEYNGKYLFGGTDNSQKPFGFTS